MITRNELNINFYSKKGTAQKLGVSVRRVEQLLKEGRFENAFTFSGTWFIPKASVDNFQRKPRGIPKGTHKYGDKLKREVSQWLEAAGYSPKKEK